MSVEQILWMIFAAVVVWATITLIGLWRFVRGGYKSDPRLAWAGILRQHNTRIEHLFTGQLTGKMDLKRSLEEYRTTLRDKLVDTPYRNVVDTEVIHMAELVIALQMVEVVTRRGEVTVDRSGVFPRITRGETL